MPKRTPWFRSRSQKKRLVPSHRADQVFAHDHLEVLFHADQQGLIHLPVEGKKLPFKVRPEDLTERDATVFFQHLRGLKGPKKETLRTILRENHLSLPAVVPSATSLPTRPTQPPANPTTQGKGLLDRLRRFTPGPINRGTPPGSGVVQGAGKPPSPSPVPKPEKKENHSPTSREKNQKPVRSSVPFEATVRGVVEIPARASAPVPPKEPPRRAAGGATGSKPPGGGGRGGGAANPPGGGGKGGGGKPPGGGGKGRGNGNSGMGNNGKPPGEKPTPKQSGSGKSWFSRLFPQRERDFRKERREAVKQERARGQAARNRLRDRAEKAMGKVQRQRDRAIDDARGERDSALRSEDAAKQQAFSASENALARIREHNQRTRRLLEKTHGRMTTLRSQLRSARREADEIWEEAGAKIRSSRRAAGKGIKAAHSRRKAAETHASKVLNELDSLRAELGGQLEQLRELNRHAGTQNQELGARNRQLEQELKAVRKELDKLRKVAQEVQGAAETPATPARKGLLSRLRSKRSARKRASVAEATPSEEPKPSRGERRASKRAAAALRKEVKLRREIGRLSAIRDSKATLRERTRMNRERIDPLVRKLRKMEAQRTGTSRS